MKKDRGLTRRGSVTAAAGDRGFAPGVTRAKAGPAVAEGVLGLESAVKLLVGRGLEDILSFLQLVVNEFFRGGRKMGESIGHGGFL